MMMMNVIYQTPVRPYSPLLRSLHWLPIRQRIEYQIALITYKALKTSNPPYLGTSRAVGPTFSDAPYLVLPRTRTELAKRAFALAARSRHLEFTAIFVTVKLF